MSDIQAVLGGRALVDPPFGKMDEVLAAAKVATCVSENGQAWLCSCRESDHMGTKKQPRNFAVVLVKLDKDQLVLMTGSSGCVQAFPHETDAVHYFEDAYNRFHGRGYESSMSACLHAILYQPSVVVFASRDAMLRGLGITNPKKATVIEAGSVCGGVSGILMESPKAKRAWERGVKPQLIRQGAAWA